MIFNFMSLKSSKSRSLSALPLGSTAKIQKFELAPQVAEHLMNLGFMPGVDICPTRSGPGDNPRVYRIDGNEVALRRDVSDFIAVSNTVADGENA